ncbi:MAG: alanine racemase [Chloroflexi bacterium]|nr:alanine racemase [Chloroflexota bacterium]
MSDQSFVIGHSKWDLDTPAYVIDLDVLERNIERMSSCIRDGGVGWRPHTKGIKVPALAHKLLRAGAFGVTCAKVGEAEVLAGAGIRDIMIANQVVGAPKIARVVNLLPWADVIVAVDDPSNVAALSCAAAEKGVELRVVIEVDTGMKRAGVAPGEPVVRLARVVHDAPNLRLAGVMGWEGHVIRIEDPAEKRSVVERSVGMLVDSAEACRREGMPMDIVSCGGTGDYTYSASVHGVTEVQAGGGIYCDVMYRKGMHVDHEYAATILATVISRPTPTRIITDSGKKTMSSDGAVPEPLIDDQVQSVALAAEHATIEVAEPSKLEVGDKIEFIVGYTDTTTMLHDELYAVRGGKVEVIWPILGRGKLR